MRTPREIAEDLSQEQWASYSAASEVRSLARAFLELLYERRVPWSRPEFEWLVQHVRWLAGRVSELEKRPEEPPPPPPEHSPMPPFESVLLTKEDVRKMWGSASRCALASPHPHTSWSACSWNSNIFEFRWPVAKS